MIVVVSDTSAISALLQVGEIEIFRKLYGQILKELLTRITVIAGFRLSPAIRIAVLNAAGEY